VCRNSLRRCGLGFPGYLAYHDGEAGTPVTAMALNCLRELPHGPASLSSMLSCS